MAIAQISAKSELLENNDNADNIELMESLEQKILQLCNENSEGVTNSKLTNEIPELTPALQVEIVNKLLSARTIELCKKGQTLVYRKRNTIVFNQAKSEQAVDVASLTPTQQLVLQKLEDAAGSGLYSRDICKKTNIPHPDVTRILKFLQENKLVTFIKVQGRGAKSKVYLLEGVEPDVKLTNPTLELTAYQIDTIFAITLKILSDKNEKYLSIDEIYFLLKSDENIDFEIPKLKLELVLQNLADEGKLELKLNLTADSLEEADVTKYRIQKRLLTRLMPSGHSLTPCGVCPLIGKCHDIGIISPNNCLYLHEWLTF